MNILIDLENDLKKFLKKQLGFSNGNLEEDLKFFFNVEQKTIEKKPRVVSLSKELLLHPLFINEKKSVIENLIKTIEKGDGINIYLSHQRKNIKLYDTALIMFDVFHLHLGDKIEKRGKRKGLIKGTEALLFVKVTDSTIYFIDILNHNKTEGFFNRNILDILYKNWPDLFEKYRINDIKVEKQRFSNQEFSDLVKNNVLFPFQAEDGSQFFFPGSTSGSGSDTRLLRNINDVLKFISDIEEKILNNKTMLGEFINSKAKNNFNTFTYKLAYSDKKFSVQEINSKLQFFLGENNEILSIDPNL